jgi:serine/threonine protein kinase
LIQKVGKFELREVLGKGTSGTVYHALDTFSGQDVALKLLDPQVVQDSEEGNANLRQFLNEASLAGKLAHPHIVTILEAAIQERSGYIAVEYVPGGSLARFTRAQQLLALEDAVEIAFKCCGALDYAFRQGIVHRDIKPANILVTPALSVKVGDFGAAFLYRGQQTQIADIGSPLYMSPEQITGKELGHQSDMFALGVVLYELFTGRRPFAGATLPEVFKTILRDEPAPPSALRPDIGARLDGIILQMLRKEPAERFPTWADVALELAAAGRLGAHQRSIPDSEKFVALRKIALLSGLSDAEIWELAHAATWKRVPARSAVVREGDAGKSLFFLGAGEARVTKQGRLLDTLRAGEYFGEMAYLKRGAMPRQASVETTEDSLLAEFEAEGIARVSSRCQLQLSQVLLDALVDRLALADQRLTQRAG